MGREANAKEKERAAESAVQYIEAKGYDKDTSVTTVKSGDKPLLFTCHFLGWDASKSKSGFVDPYEAKLAAIKAANPPPEEPPPPAPTPPPPKAPVVPPIAASAAAAAAGGSYTLNYDELKKPADQLPAGLNLMKKEDYLADDEFVKVLGSPRSEFAALKPWKQAQLKKAAGIF